MRHIPNGLPLGEGEVLVGARVADGYGAAGDLVAPPREVTPRLDGHADVRLEGERVHGARVDGLDGGQLLLVLLHQVGQAVQEPSAVPRAHLGPLALLERLLGGAHRPVHVTHSRSLDLDHTTH